MKKFCPKQLKKAKKRKVHIHDFAFLKLEHVVMQNPIPKLRQISIISKKPCFLSEKLKTLTSSN